MLEFRPVEHRYYWSGVEIPSVTAVLEGMQDFAHIPRWIFDRKTAIGQAVHIATELIDADNLDPDSVDPAIAGYLDGYRLFLSDRKPKWSMSETQLADPELRYAGTIDRFGQIDGELAMVDLKTTVEIHPIVGVQLAGYENLRQKHHKAIGLDAEPAERLALQLLPNGSYRLQRFADADDMRAFLNLLNLYRWRAKHGI